MTDDVKPKPISVDLSKVFSYRNEPFSEDHHHVKLLRAIQERLPQLKELKESSEEMWGSIDYFYRYYHQSFKAYRIQKLTSDIVKVFLEIQEKVEWEPKNWPLDWQFLEIVEKGTGLEFHLDHNKDWHAYVGPQFEAYFHAKMFLDLMIRCGERMDSCSGSLPSDWAAVLYLFRMR